MRRRICWGCGLAVLLVWLPSYAQRTPDPSSSPHATVRLYSDPERAEVWLDGRFLGMTPFRDTTIGRGQRVFSLFFPSRMNWNAIAAVETVDVQPLGTVERTIRLPGRMLIASQPSEADVFLDTQRIGRTPLEVTNDRPAPLSLVLREDGYESATLTADSSGFRSALVRMVPTPAQQAAEAVREGEHPSGKSWLVAGSVATGVLSGIVAAALKERADHVYDDYLVTRDPALRDRSRRLDTGAAVAFAIMEVSIGILMYSLMSD